LARDQKSVIKKHVRRTTLPYAMNRIRWAVGRRLGRG